MEKRAEMPLWIFFHWNCSSLKWHSRISFENKNKVRCCIKKYMLSKNEGYYLNQIRIFKCICKAYFPHLLREGTFGPQNKNSLTRVYITEIILLEGNKSIS